MGRNLLSAQDTGPPPGGGINNNSLAATNGNTAARLNASAVAATVSPGLPPARSNISPGPPARSNISPGMHISSMSPGLQVRSNLSPAIRNNLSPGMLSSMSTSLPVRPGSMPNSSLSGGKRSARPSPSASRSATPRVSPATVTISSGGSSPNNSRPSSPTHSASFRPINPPGPSLPNSRSPSPDIEIIEEVVKTPRLVANHKRLRREDSDVRLENKRPKLDFGHQNGTDGIARDGAITASGSGNRPPQPSSDKPSMLNKQISMAKRSGKVKTTQELIENLGIESRHNVSPPVPHNVNNLVPDENKEELMNRFFESQDRAREEDEESMIEIISRPNTADPASSASSNSVSAVSSRVQTPVVVNHTAGQTVEDVLAQLSPISDPSAVIAEWEARMEDEEEIEGLIPVFKPTMEITEQVIHDLNNDGQLEHVSGVRDHAGTFKEWHEVVSKQSLDGQLIHILPYSVID